MNQQESIAYRPIGIIHSEHREAQQTPIQPVFAVGCVGTVEIFPEYVEGLVDLEEYSHFYLLYHFHRAGASKLRVTPFLDNAEHGVFATRVSDRPNPIGLSIVRLVKREGNVITFADLDVLDGAPLLDIKPYTARFDCVRTLRNGWQDRIDDETAERLGRRGYRAGIESSAGR